MRYTIKWNNGYWKLFDNSQYRDADFFYLYKDIVEVADRVNKD